MKIAFIVHDFRRKNINKQPWKYIYELAIYFQKYFDDIVILTDVSSDDIDEIRVLSIPKLFTPFIGETNDLLELLGEEKPDKCIMLLGLTSFLRKEFKLKIPVIGIFTSPLYSFRELIRNIGIKDILKYHDYTFIHLLNSLIPRFFIKHWGAYFEKIIFLSNDTKNKLVNKGFDDEKSLVILSGLEEDFIELTEEKDIIEARKLINPDNVPVIMYFTSPLTLRGTDTLVKAFSRVRKKKEAKLIFLSRIDDKELILEEQILMKIAKKSGISNSIEILSEFLSIDELKKYLSIADIICLPFKIILSDAPISLLEGMALKKAIISTKVASIPEILGENGITIEPNDPEQLSNIILYLLNNNELLDQYGVKGRDFMEKYHTWDDVGEKFLKLIK